MKIWFVAIGEPVPLGPNFTDRLHRTGMMATAFAAAGHDVTWWTSGFDHFKKRHLTRHRKEVQHGANLRIRIVPAPGYRTNVSVARLYHHELVRRRFAQWARMSDPPQVIVSSLPTVGLCAASISLGRMWGIPVIADLRDMWPDIFSELAPAGLRPAFRFALQPLFRDCRNVCRNATALIGITESFLNWGLRRAGRERGELDLVVPFVYPEAQFSADDLSRAERFWNAFDIRGRGGQKVVTFLGTLGRHFHLDAVIRCAQRMTVKDPQLRFALCGAGDNLDLFKDMAGGNPAIVFPGWIDSVKIRVLLQRTSLGLDPMLNRFDFLATINNKAVEYLASGVPILSTPADGALADLIRQTGIGESTTEGDESALQASLMRMLGNPAALENMSVNARRVYADRFHPATVYGTLIAHVERMAK
jgi:glycosyltransferase involved in cell wall biosynthesis